MELFDIANEATQQVLTSQYVEAMKLYIHEDNLNWQKLYTFFYVTAALFAAFGLSLSQKIRGLGYAIMICLLGILISFGFIIANWNGVQYLDKRKASVEEIEKRLIDDYGGLPIVAKKDQLLKESPTRYLIISTPCVLLIFWIAVLIIIFFRRKWFGLQRLSIKSNSA
jgi:hypothetical protein